MLSYWNSDCIVLCFLPSLEPQRLFKDQAHSKPTHAPSRPLLDKTPFANRAGAVFITPLPHSSKKLPFAKLPLADHSHQTPTLLRPSSTRKHIRVPRSASKSFETPQSQGNHWDVSDISIECPDVGAAVVNESIEEEDYDEIEYMPPTAVGKIMPKIYSFSSLYMVHHVCFRTSLRAAIRYAGL